MARLKHGYEIPSPRISAAQRRASARTAAASGAKPWQATGMAMSAIIGAMNAYNQAQAIKAGARHDAAVSEINKRLAELQERETIAMGKKAAQQHRKATQRLIGQQRAAYAAQGIEVNEDVAAAVQADTAALGALDALAIESNAYRQAYGLGTQAIEYGAQAQFARIGGRARAGQTMLTGGLRVARDVSRGIYEYRRG